MMMPLLLLLSLLLLPAEGSDEVRGYPKPRVPARGRRRGGEVPSNVGGAGLFLVFGRSLYLVERPALRDGERARGRCCSCGELSWSRSRSSSAAAAAAAGVEEAGRGGGVEEGGGLFCVGEEWREREREREKKGKKKVKREGVEETGGRRSLEGRRSARGKESRCRKGRRQNLGNVDRWGGGEGG